MKKILSLLLIILFVTACKQETNRTDYVINGNAKDIYNGIRVYLKKMDEQGKQVPIDTAIVMNETFTFIGKVDFPSLHFIAMNSADGVLPFMLENSEIEVVINKKNMFESEVEGSETTADLREFSDKANQYKVDLQTVSTLLDNAKFIKDSVNVEKYDNELETLKTDLYEFPYKFIEDHKESFVTLQIIENQLRTPQLDFDKLQNAFSSLGESVKQSEPALRLKGKMDLIESQVKREQAVQIGKMAPNFSAPDPDGNMISLEDIKGKVTIVDFWAAWCGPCRRENPNVVRVYNKYHDKGLEIIGVSLDGSRTQQNPKISWLSAIAADKLTWTHVSNLKHFAEPVAQLYNVNSIPATFILDDEGKIVAKNLRGPALELKIAELLGE